MTKNFVSIKEKRFRTITPFFFLPFFPFLPRMRFNSVETNNGSIKSRYLFSLSCLSCLFYLSCLILKTRRISVKTKSRIKQSSNLFYRLCFPVSKQTKRIRKETTRILRWLTAAISSSSSPTVFFSKIAFEPPSSSSGKSGNFCVIFLKRKTQRN